MNQPEQVKEIILYWVSKAEDSLASASDEMKAGRLSFAVNRIYYACFYIISAILLQENHKFTKHSGVRSSFHRNLVKTGKISRESGKFYDELFEARQRGDYLDFVYFDLDLVTDWLGKARRFVQESIRLITV
jgi:uncharacterized protein